MTMMKLEHGRDVSDIVIWRSFTRRIDDEHFLPWLLAGTLVCRRSKFAKDSGSVLFSLLLLS